MAILARINPIVKLFRPLKKRAHMRIFQSLDARFISFLEAQTRDDAIDSLIHLLDQGKKLPDKEAFRQAIFCREKIVSTGIGMGVAIPHAKMKNFSHFFIAIGIQKKKGIDWNALDLAPVRLVFMIGGPDDQQSEYLQILSQLTAIIKNVDLRKSLLKAHSQQQVLDLLSGF